MTTDVPLAGRTAIVTGANRGLGLEIARASAAAGADLALGARDDALLEEEGRRLAGAFPGRRILWRRLDVASEGDTLAFARWSFGHGGRIGCDREWRADPVRSGGELIGQGPHLIDLARWFLDDFVEIQGSAHTYFWDMPVDDNAFLLLKTNRQQVALLHASCTEWKNAFSFEIYGRRGKIDMFGLGGSYGAERITFYRMLPEMGPPETTSSEFPMADYSWAVEFEEFLDDIRLDRTPAAGLPDAVATLRIIESVHEVSGYDHRA